MSSLATPAAISPAAGLWLRLRVALFSLLALMAIYTASIGPMSPLLCHHGGERGYAIWQAVYGEPLGKLPKPCRNAANRYLSVSERIYWQIFRGAPQRPAVCNGR